MTYLRGQERLVHQSFCDHLEARLTALGWIGTAPYPFGAADPIKVVTVVPKVKDVLAVNTVAVTQGLATDDVEGELGASGGGLWRADHLYFIDIYGESVGIAKAIASDIAAILRGRLEGTSRYIQVKDYTQEPAVAAPGHTLYIEGVDLEEPDNQPYQRVWRSVKVEATHEFNAVEYGGVV